MLKRCGQTEIKSRKVNIMFVLPHFATDGWNLKYFGTNDSIDKTKCRAVESFILEKLLADIEVKGQNCLLRKGTESSFSGLDSDALSATYFLYVCLQTILKTFNNSKWHVLKYFDYFIVYADAISIFVDNAYYI